MGVLVGVGDGVALVFVGVELLVGGRLQALRKPEEVITKMNLEQAFQVPVSVIPHPDYGTPMVLPDGRKL